MFEKEAEEWVENNLHSTEEDYTKAFKGGAEFGYNKANEWHYVKDGYYPKDSNNVLVLLKDKIIQVDYYFSKIGWNISVNADVIAWCEIPTFKEE